jgi:phosphohistidine phosphatase
MKDKPKHNILQVAVIPFRRHQGGLQILLISARRRKHWTVPKGYHHGNHALTEIAAMKAWEEAGVQGKISQSVLGTYRYRKKRHYCFVYVYPMEVHTIADKWHQNRRKRKWLTLEDAAYEINDAELGRLAQSLPDFLLGAELRQLIEHLPAFTNPPK